MRLVKYTLCDIELAMVDIEGVLYCPPSQLYKALGVDDGDLERVVLRYPKEFPKTTYETFGLTDDRYRELVASLESEQTLKRPIWKKTRLWSEDDIIGITFLSRSSATRKFRPQFIKLIKQRMKEAPPL